MGIVSTFAQDVGFADHLTVELLALAKGLKVCLQLQVSKLTVPTDCMQIVHLFHNFDFLTLAFYSTSSAHTLLCV
jgi:hypothetical protein